MLDEFKAGKYRHAKHSLERFSPSMLNKSAFIIAYENFLTRADMSLQN
ncbi:hypothetical protein EMIT0P201_40231 [Pseudomonas chlororaphis]